MLPVTRLLPLKDSTACPDLPTAEDHMCSNGSLEGPFHTQTTTGSVCPPCSVFFPVSLLIQNVCLENGKGSCHGMSEVKGIPFPLGSTCFSCLASPSVETLEPF